MARYPGSYENEGFHHRIGKPSPWLLYGSWHEHLPLGSALSVALSRPSYVKWFMKQEPGRQIQFLSRVGAALKLAKAAFFFLHLQQSQIP